MNRLLYSRAYLVGPMDEAREDGKVWRQDIEEFLDELGVLVLNPYDKPLHSCHETDLMLEDDDSFAERQEAKKNGNYNKLAELMKPICHVDLRMVDHADFIVAYLNFDVIMSGTLEEIWTANREKKPILIFSNVPKCKIPDWYYGRLPHKLFFENLQEIKSYLQEINSARLIDTLNRWIFFDVQEKIEKIRLRYPPCSSLC